MEPLASATAAADVGARNALRQPRTGLRQGRVPAANERCRRYDAWPGCRLSSQSPSAVRGGPPAAAAIDHPIGGGVAATSALWAGALN